MAFGSWNYLRSRAGHTEADPIRVYLEGQLTEDMQVNIQTLANVYDYPDNDCLKIRYLHIRALQVSAAVLYVEGATDGQSVERTIMKPLLEIDAQLAVSNPDERINAIRHQLLPSLSVKVSESFQELNDALLHGNTVLFIPFSAKAILIDTPGFEYRTVEKPQVEQVLRGPKEAFIESSDVNRSLIRKYIKDHNLRCEKIKTGKHKQSTLLLMYMRNIADDKIVDRVKKRIEQVQTDAVTNLFMLEQSIEERPYSLIPSVLLTERPDRAAAFLQEGHVVVLMDNSPVALIAPVTFWSLFHAAEDQYQRWVVGNFMRLIRLFAMLVTMLIPGTYMAITTFHVEMLPTDLMLAISASRERVPFPIVFEIIFMELTFEMIRESGVRVPQPIGTTIGIVGALVLGQAAVDANLVSPILVIIVAITGLASYIIPDIALNFAIRVQRFIFIIFGYMFGFFGLALYMTFVISYLVSFKSFGVPFMSPMAPKLPSSRDTFTRQVFRKQWLRPFGLSPKEKYRQNKPEGN